jgi:hypothetical protein
MRRIFMNNMQLMRFRIRQMEKEMEPTLKKETKLKRILGNFYKIFPSEKNSKKNYPIH